MPFAFGPSKLAVNPAWGSASMARTARPARAKSAARFAAVVVLVQPPF